METSHKILVVDDNPASRYATSRVLRSVGYNVIEAGTAGTGLEMAKEHPELILLDVNLPDFDGFEACQKFRELPDTASVPIIHFSAAHISSADKIKGLELGADGYLTHPTEPAVLVATVNAFLRAKRAEEALRLSESRFKAVFDNAINGIAIFDKKFTWVEANPAFTKLLQVSKAQLIGSSLSDSFASDERLLLEDVAVELARQGAWKGDFPILRKDGTAVYLEWNLSRHTERGTYLALVTDITERLADEKLRADLLVSERNARSEAERSNRLKDEFLATVSHELRTPLTSIVGWSELLLAKDLSEDVTHGLEIISRNAKIQADLINDLLDVARITSGKLGIEPEPTALRALIDSGIQSISQTASAKNIEIEANLRSVPLVMVDPGRMSQVISNLLTNAVKFTPSGGKVFIELYEEDSRIEILVRDTGRGIEPDLLPHIFERFTQADGSRKRIHGGLGIGLAISQQVMLMHNGSLTAYSEGLNKGSTFKISLVKGVPATLQLFSQPGDSSSGSTSNKSLAGVTALVLEDDNDSREIVRRILVESKAKVIEAESVDEALEALESETPQIVISDIGMPNRDGYDFIAALRARYAGEAVPAIAVTAYSTEADTERLFAAGFQAHLVKPVSPSDLALAVYRLCFPVED